MVLGHLKTVVNIPTVPSPGAPARHHPRVPRLLQSHSKHRPGHAACWGAPLDPALNKPPDWPISGRWVFQNPMVRLMDLPWSTMIYNDLPWSTISMVHLRHATVATSAVTGKNHGTHMMGSIVPWVTLVWTVHMFQVFVWGCVHSCFAFRWLWLLAEYFLSESSCG